MPALKVKDNGQWITIDNGVSASGILEEAKAYTNQMFQLIYPIGAIYLSASDIPPDLLFGFGTWEQIKDVFLLSAGDAYEAGNSGGESEHILTEEEMPAHSHIPTTKTVESDTHNNYQFQIMRNVSSISTARRTVAAGDDYYAYTADPLAEDFVSNRDLYYCNETATTGGSAAHNNMPPYLTVYMWKRIE